MRIGYFTCLLVLMAGISPIFAQSESQPTATPPGSTQPGTIVGSDGLPILDADPALGDVIGGTLPDTLWYGRAEYLLWRISNSQLPNVQLTVPFPLTGVDQFQSQITLPAGDVDHGGRSGGRFTLGRRLLSYDLNVEGTFFQFERRGDAFFLNQLDNIPLQVTIQQNITEQVVSGGTVITTQTQEPLEVTIPATISVQANGTIGPVHFYGAELNLTRERFIFGGVTFDLLGGFRFVNLDEDFRLTEVITLRTADPTTVVNNGLVQPSGTNGLAIPQVPRPVTNLQTLFTTTSQNSIQTRNRFYGGQVGTAFEWVLGPRLFVNGFGKIAAGGIVQSIQLVNFTTINSAASGQAFTNGGALTPIAGALQTGRTRYALVPEFNVNVGVQLTSNIKVSVGYNFLYITTVARPGNQIVFAPTNEAIRLAGTENALAPVQPTFVYQDIDFIAQGLVGTFQIDW
ncbi:MAG: hypothetical protein KatS3mg105_1586 [Gemmatales bacterium]|nr:MAG: hypothetical protein KatS3mg105_1586 [Gemmatales bacterium]